MIQNIFDEAGQMKADYQERYAKNVQVMLDELLWFAQLLKSARQSRS
jgi:hypothetical protein